ncbi:LacI family DNA-binding transcriptional regulator [Brachybacterium sp. AOP43-C2-M15]|uniref:LacI family DNA-binding transcriptional regulator n=1 Tax=Brachybacterium sp. AOP43-C2-M15 TaxID=3457661 RepID=UPI00403477F5
MGTICIAIPDSVWSAHSEQFYTQVLHGLEDTAVPRGHGVLSRVARDVEQELDALRHWAEQLPGAVAVLKDLREDDARPRLADELGLPYVVICDERERRLSSRVTVDNDGTMRRLLEDLRGLGHEAIGHVGGPPDLLHSRWRREAYEAFVGEPARPSLTAVGDYGRLSGAECTQRLLGAAVPPSVIVYDNDAMAIGGCERALELGLMVPEELSVVAWDDSPACRTHIPELAVIDRSPHQLGVVLGQVASALLRAPQDVHCVVQDPPRLLRRDTLSRRRALPSAR